MYFRNILPQLKGIYLYEVWDKILRMIARRIHSTCLYPSDWKDFAAETGINDSLVLEEIEISATIKKELPLCVAFCGPLQYNYTLYDIIQALINLNRADVLCLIREEFEDFWDEQSAKMLQRRAHADIHGNRASTQSVFNAEPPKDNPSLTGDGSCPKNLSSRNETETGNWESAETHSATNLNNSGNEKKDDELFTKEESKDCAKMEDSSPFGILGCLDREVKLDDVKFIQCKPLNNNVTRKSETLLKVDISEFQTKQHCEEVLKVDVPKLPPTRSPDPISVFVIYVGCEVATGIRLANKLRDAGLRVITISEAELMIRIDRSGFLKKLLEKVDFIVPVLCDEYMTCVRPDSIRRLNSNDERTNRFIFTWLHSEYENNACLNFRVKPVIVENFDWCLVGNDPIFQWVHQLWTEVDDLVRVLHGTKQLMDNVMDLWSQEEFVDKWMNFLNPN